MRFAVIADSHIRLTDDDIARRTSYAVKINAVTDAARPLEMRGAAGEADQTPGKYTHDLKRGEGG